MERTQTMRRRALAALALAALAAAAGFGGRSSPPPPDVAPLFAEKCAGCHTTGGIAPFSLTSARSAARHAQEILAMTQIGAMPPWPPGSDSPAYVGGTTRVLTPAEKDL